MNRTTGFILTLLLLLALAACGGNGGADGVPVQDDVDPGLMAQLEAELQRYFDEHGIDPAKTVNAAPDGSINQVFDLAATAIDADGDGPNPPTGIEVAWTERHVGDYDMNGEVNVADLTPLGVYFGQSVAHTETNGFAYWPTGDPDGSAEDKLNWRKARVDGDDNALMTIADVTPIGANFKRFISGWRIYRRAPGEAGFTLLPHSDGSSPFTLNRPSVDPAAPVRLFFTDDDPLTPGTYEYQVAAYDVNGSDEGTLSVIASVVIGTTGSNVPPVADIQAAPTSGLAPLEVDFDATASQDPDGSIVEYEWDIDGNGSFELSTGTTATTSTTYNSEGLRNVKVRVTDDEGATATDNVNVTVTEGGGNQPPIASFTIDPEPAAGAAPLEVQFDGSASSDPDGTVTTWEWDFNGDGTFDETNVGVATASFTYNNPGSYKPRLRVLDDFLPKASGSMTYAGTINVAEAGKPVAVLEADITSGSAPFTVNFDGTASFDPEGGAINLYEFDLDGDGLYEVSQASPQTSKLYTENGPPISASLRVTNDTAVVSNPDTVVIEFDFSGWVQRKIDNNGVTYTSLAMVDGHPAVAYRLNSDGLKYARATDEFGTVWGTVAEADVEDEDAIHHGNGYYADLIVADGRPAIGYFEDSVQPNPDDDIRAVKFVRALDSIGETWGPPVVVADDVPQGIGLWGVSAVVANGNPALAWRDAGAARILYARANDAQGSSWPGTFVTVANQDCFDTDMLIVNGVPAMSIFMPGDTNVERFVLADNADGSSWGDLVNAGSGRRPVLTFVDGNPATGSALPIPQSDVFQARYARATNATGSSWGSPVNLTSEEDELLNIGVGFGIVNGLPCFAYVNRSNSTLNYVKGSDAAGSSFEAPEIVLNTITGLSSGWCQIMGVGDGGSQPLIVFSRFEAPTGGERGLRALVFFE